MTTTNVLDVVDFDFIHSLEQSGDATGATVPHPDGSKSGVTVAHGVDLGQMDANFLDSLALSEGLKKKLLPYVGLRGRDALAFLSARPLRLSHEDVKLLDHVVYGKLIDEVANNYNKEAPAYWNDILPEAATVLASLAIQYGPQLSRRMPKFWRMAIEEDYSAMIAELRDFCDAYHTRRCKEATYLEVGLYR
ncbi:pesticin C-terminus-like muramidase [Phytohalomonas tamaricis]|uniref:pesticin C-terminus-like muramidase n=1 Tax=Phytohalomonas tamaricis TaxID=2081032 RepID=UPI000D0ABE9D|nr:pesticin C-terminus-like muramidase [Phytohalomonas tamaricis]